MKTSLRWIFAGICILGLLCGFVAKRMAAPENDSAATASENSENSGTARNIAPPRAAAGRSLAESAAELRSHDTLDELLALGDQVTYQRLALWLLDAPPGEIAAYWQAHTTAKKRDRNITDLIMASWTRIDPQGATSAVAGTRFEDFAWWAWAAHDPQAALSAAMATNPSRVPNVAWGIGEFHPKWLREHFGEIPSSARRMAMQGLEKWGETRDPLVTCEFLKDQGMDPPRLLLRHFIEQDPMAAWNWLSENNGRFSRSNASATRRMEFFLRMLRESHPDILEQIAAETPPGKQKEQVETAIFDHLLATNPDTAVKQALAIKDRNLAYKRLSAAVSHLLTTNPDRAFEIAGQLFGHRSDDTQENPGMTAPTGNGTITLSNYSETRQLLEKLSMTDFARTVQLDDSPPDRIQPFQLAEIAVKDWARADPDGVAKWFDEEATPELRKRALAPYLQVLFDEGQFEEAARHVEESDNPGGYAEELLYEWRFTNRERALQWLENADIPAERKDKLRNAFFPENR